MPWHWEPKKDVTSCDKLREGANIRYDPQISEWGNPPVVMYRYQLQMNKDSLQYEGNGVN